MCDATYRSDDPSLNNRVCVAPGLHHLDHYFIGPAGPVTWPNHGAQVVQPVRKKAPARLPDPQLRDRIREAQEEQKAAEAAAPTTTVTRPPRGTHHGVPERLRVPATPDQDMVGALNSDPMDTSADAAFEVTPRTGTQRRSILDWVASQGDNGATDEEMQHRLGLRYSSECARRKELERGGWIEDSGRRRLTTSNSPAAVWVLTTKGRLEYGISEPAERALRDFP